MVHDELNTSFSENYFGKSEITASNAIISHEKKQAISHFTRKKLRSFMNHENTLYPLPRNVVVVVDVVEFEVAGFNCMLIIIMI